MAKSSDPAPFLANRARLSAGIVLTILAMGAAGCRPAVSNRIAVIVPLTGSTADYGRAILEGIELARDKTIQEVDSGKSIVLEVFDSRGDPERARDLLSAAYRNGATAAIGGISNSEWQLMTPVAEAAHRLLLSPSASQPADESSILRRSFRIFCDARQEESRLAQFAIETLGLRSFEVVFSGDEGRGLFFSREIDRLGGSLARSSSEVHPPLPGSPPDRVCPSGVDAVLVLGGGSDLEECLHRLEKCGFEGLVLASSAIASSELLERLGPIAEGIVLALPTSGGQIVLEELSGLPHDHPPDIFLAHGYDALRVLISAIENEGRPGLIWRGMRAITDFPGVTGSIAFDEKGGVRRFPRIHRVHEGRLQDYEHHLRDLMDSLRKRQNELEQRRKTLTTRSERSQITAG